MGREAALDLSLSVTVVTAQASPGFDNQNLEGSSGSRLCIVGEVCREEGDGFIYFDFRNSGDGGRQDTKYGQGREYQQWSRAGHDFERGQDGGVTVHGERSFLRDTQSRHLLRSEERRVGKERRS